MRKYKDFDEMMADTTSPLNNPDFYGLILTEYDRRINNRLIVPSFSLCHEYNLGTTTYSTYQQLMGVVLNTYISHITDDECMKRHQHSKDELKKYIDFILDPSHSRERVEEFFKNNAKWFSNSLGTLSDGFTRIRFYVL